MGFLTSFREALRSFLRTVLYTVLAVSVVGGALLGFAWYQERLQEARFASSVRFRGTPPVTRTADQPAWREEGAWQEEFELD